MSKNKFWKKQQENEQTPVVETVAAKSEETPPPDPDGIAPGQVYEGVKVPDRKINIMGLTPGATLGPLVIEAPYTDTNDGWWFAFFEGEGCTGIKLYVDAEMLKSGKLRK